MSIKKAIEFSTKAHAGQFRKGSKLPYISHPLEVADILSAELDPKTYEALICAGLLHDTLEDTNTSLMTIEKEFGKEVANLVLSDSEDKCLSWEKRKQMTLDFLKTEATKEMLLLACADKLSNMRSTDTAYQKIGDEVWERFVRGKEKQGWYYEGIVQTLKPLKGFLMYEELSELVKKIFERQ